MNFYKDILPGAVMAGAGGAVGAVARSICMLWDDALVSLFFVNVAGCLLFGLFMRIIEIWRSRSSTYLSNLLLAGFCGGFTSFSALAAVSLALYHDNGAGLWILYMAAMTLLGVWMLVLGKKIANKLLKPSEK